MREVERSDSAAALSGAQRMHMAEVDAESSRDRGRASGALVHNAVPTATPRNSTVPDGGVDYAALSLDALQRAAWRDEAEAQCVDTAVC